MIRYKIEGMNKLLKDLKKLGKAPQSCVTPAAKKGMTIALKQARANAPYETGILQKGTILVGEKARTQGKKVYRIVFDRALNDVFQKKNKKGEVTGYYPVSQEYGFFARNGRYIPGYRFIADSLNDNVQKISKTMVDEAQKKINAEFAKAGLR